MMTEQQFKLQCPVSCHVGFDAEMGKVSDPKDKGTILSILQQLIAELKALGIAIPWTQLIALIPVIALAITTGDWTAVIAAIAALLTPKP